jgi:hypothetical protein
MGYVADDKYHFKEIAYSQAAVGAIAIPISLDTCRGTYRYAG